MRILKRLEKKAENVEVNTGMYGIIAKRLEDKEELWRELSCI